MKKTFLLLALFLAIPFALAAPCGNGLCNPGETCSSCPADCGVCPTVVPTVTPTVVPTVTPTIIPTVTPTIIPTVTPTGVPTVTPTTAPTVTPTTTPTSDTGTRIVLPLNIVFKNPAPEQTLKRGNLLLTVAVYTGNQLEWRARVKATSSLFAGSVDLYDDGTHGDTIQSDGIFSNNLSLNNAVAGRHAITVSAERTGSDSGFDEDTISITIAPDLTISIEPEESYESGERVVLNGFVTDFTGAGQPNVKVNITLSNSETKIVQALKTGKNGSFNYSHLISFLEPEGVWNAIATAVDSDNNYGSANRSFSVGIPAGVAYYEITFLSPPQGAVFFRGNDVQIVVNVKDEGKPAEKLSVTAKNPSREDLVLQEISPGTYSAAYYLKISDPLKTWNLGVEAIKRNENGSVERAGWKSIPVVVEQTKIVYKIISPKETRFYLDSSINITIQAAYSDGTPVEGGRITAGFSPDKPLAFSETEPGLYTAVYKVSSEDAGKSISLSARISDQNSNQEALKPLVLYIEPQETPKPWFEKYYSAIIAPYWYAILLVSLLATAIVAPRIHKLRLKTTVGMAQREAQLIAEMKKTTQTKYYKERSITRDEYASLMKEYENRLSKLRETRAKAEKELSKTKAGK
ncbi:MAG: choice-of-anchor X domain-containing protein [Candidatus Micrarchaeota archaeon]